ncbi:MAG: flagellar basal body P-ring protein FlgI [Deltaproteobacteria bacterium]|nr:flagellar basal body P-ring protein FlgI [Candidatus Anaeroferrophillus wilburensis]MBN2889606.1 flagellar basal body P-ring protein FlgI [Deltaproteobacteria bacterium]
MILKCAAVFLVLASMVLGVEVGYAVRLKDIASIQGVRTNQLVGYGLIAGLDGTGDDTKKGKFASEGMANFLEKLGMPVDATTIDLDNVAAVMVTAELPPFARNGSRLDVLVSSIGDAESLHGGTLLLTPLRGPDGNVYAVAQGAVSVGGFSLGGAGGKSAKNHPTVGRIVNGAQVEREPPSQIFTDGKIVLSLHQPDFMTVSRVSRAINDTFGTELAVPIDAATVEMEPPSREKRAVVPFLAALENLQIVPDSRAKVVFDERTGTVVMGRDVMIDTVAIAHGDLSVQIAPTPQVSQPEPFSGGQTVVTAATEITVTEEDTRLMVLPKTVQIDELVRALNAVGVTPRDLMSILQAIKAAGALHADLEIM